MNIDRWVVVVSKYGEWEPAHPGHINRHDALNLGEALWEQHIVYEIWTADKWNQYQDDMALENEED